MVKNTTGGNKTKKQKRNFGKYDGVSKIEHGQMFAKIIHNNGGSFSVLCSDGITRLGKLTGEMKKGPRLSEGSYVVISLREFESEQKHCDIIAHGDPSHDIINILKNDSKSSKKVDVDFADSDDEFKEFEESNRTIKKIDNNPKTNKQTNSNNNNNILNNTNNNNTSNNTSNNILNNTPNNTSNNTNNINSGQKDDDINWDDL
jgi:initiation factor 1A